MAFGFRHDGTSKMIWLSQAGLVMGEIVPWLTKTTCQALAKDSDAFYKYSIE